MIDQDAAHRLGGGGEEVAPVAPAVAISRADQAQVRLVDECGSVEGLPRLLVREFRGGEAAQLVVDQRQELRGGVGVALLDGGQDVGDVAHAAEHNSGGSAGQGNEAAGAGLRQHSQPAPALQAKQGTSPLSA